MLKGLENIERETRETESIASGDWIRPLRIKSGDVAFVRFLTDKEELIRAKFHDVKRTTPRGEFTVPVYCTKEDTKICQNCSSGGVPYNTLNLWVWVYYILHKNQNPNIQTGSNEGIWSQVKHGKAVMYKEEINTVMWFKTKYGFQGRYRQMFVDLVNEHETLCNRDYTWSRMGSAKNDTNYSLIAKKESEVAKEILEAKKNLPDLGDVISSKVRSFGQVKKEEASLSSQEESEEPSETSSDNDIELF